jgi:hypothetical protein
MFRQLPKFPAYVKQASSNTRTIGVTFKFDMEGVQEGDEDEDDDDDEGKELKGKKAGYEDENVRKRGKGKGDRRGSEAVEDVWEEKYSNKHGRSFWQNKYTKEIVWEKPNQGDESEQVWEEKWSDKHGKPYWQHKKTGAMVWDKPDENTIIQDLGAWDEKYSQKHGE